MPARILVIDDESEMCWAIKKNLERRGYDTAEANSGEEALEKVASESYQMCILDYKMPGIDGLETLGKIKQRSPETRVIFMTAFGNDELAMKSLELGADDFLHKPFDMKNLMFRVHKTLQFHNMETEVKTLRNQLAVGDSPFIADCDKMQVVVSQIAKMARVDAPVMVYGETGTGKEIVARAIHNHEDNPRRDEPYITVNSAAISENLIESELFGHAKGAFTGAGAMKHGLFEAANGGTFFLDEISSAPLSLQAKLLRILDSGEFMRVGESKTRKVNVRILSATNRDLAKEVEEGTFREDLYHRLNVLKISLPPVRERGDDVPRLIEHYVDYFNRKVGTKVQLSASAMKSLCAYTWPGNVRELKHSIERLILMAETDVIDIDSLPSAVVSEESPVDLNASFNELKAQTVQGFEKNYFANLIREAEGNVSKAARIANMNRAYLIKKLKEYDINTGKNV